MHKKKKIVANTWKLLTNVTKRKKSEENVEKKSKFQKEQDAKSVHFGVVVVEVINAEE